jgi:cytochrome P450
MSSTLRKASPRDSLAAASEVLLPPIAKGVIIRRPGVLSLAERWDAGTRAVQRMQRLGDDYGPDPLPLAIPGRDMALVLSNDDVRRVLGGTPEPFAAATREKQAALRHFQPHGVLASHGAERQDRRDFNEQVLGAQVPVHHLAGALLAKVVEEADVLSDLIERTGRLGWEDYIEAWMRTVRRVVLGDAARDDHALTDDLASLRAAGNFAFFRPTPRKLRARFFRQLRGHLDRAEPESLAGVMAETPTSEMTRPAQQVPQWLFAYDAAAWASFRALALLGSHPEQAATASTELPDDPAADPPDTEYLRACVLESLRLWPTTPVVLRETTAPTQWRNGTLPEGTSLVIFAPYFHRDDRQVPEAHRFAPEIWMGNTGGPQLGAITDDAWPLIPFSAGPAVCPGRNLVLLTTSAMIGTLLARHELRLQPHHSLGPDRDLPGTLSPFELTFATAGR